MKKLKKITAFLLALTMVLAMTSCGNSVGNDSSAGDNAPYAASFAMYPANSSETP